MASSISLDVMSVTVLLFQSSPTVGIMHDERTILRSFCDQCTLPIRIIVNRRSIRQREIQKAHVGEAGPVAPDNNITGNIVSTPPHAPRYAMDGVLGRRQPQIDKRQPPAIDLALCQHL
jgi:hypothetical protein